MLLDQDCHFLSGPLTSPGGRSLAWIGWDHPRMPWDGTELRVTDAPAAGRTTVFGSQEDGQQVSVVQAEWADEDTLVASGDPSGWWNLYRIRRTEGAWGAPEPLWPVEEECGGPLWGLGYRWFVPLPDGRIAVLHGRGPQRLGVLDPATGKVTDHARDLEWNGALDLSPCGHRVTGIAGNARQAAAVVEADLVTGEVRTLSTASPPVDAAYLPVPEERTYTHPSGRPVHVTVYPPRNPGYTGGREGERPPYVAFVHGGPTMRAQATLDLSVAYFTSRGLGVVQVNYGGSTGYGRAYRELLRRRWGQTDVEDATFVAASLEGSHQADPQRLAIRGGSAGGFTSAAALAFDPEHTFACATIMFPVLDLVGFAKGGTHDLEAHYLTALVGPYDEETYKDRSPINHTDALASPFLLLQGLRDPVCPPPQCYTFLERISRRDIGHQYIGFSAESHGFRKAANIIAALQAELLLYGQAFGFTPVLDRLPSALPGLSGRGEPSPPSSS
ncbi:prolyl oligopeptidase family serine peptidase [Streptomyces sp. MST-110588]|uniref:prolyl oligopeptidase family serine peptidase n=1 Tax=Streptomyces sp. MST-110588 TaxID=2833628 RepID=UPI001F5E1E88|nr:prolyl oligopeptidase family serine peptidase [Streptomyces sp. MST-110588]